MTSRNVSLEELELPCSLHSIRGGLYYQDTKLDHEALHFHGTTQQASTNQMLPIGTTASAVSDDIVCQAVQFRYRSKIQLQHLSRTAISVFFTCSWN